MRGRALDAHSLCPCGLEAECCDEDLLPSPSICTLAQLLQIKLPSIPEVDLAWLVWEDI
jgi:hypothetical protein